MASHFAENDTSVFVRKMLTHIPARLMKLVVQMLLTNVPAETFADIHLPICQVYDHHERLLVLMYREWSNLEKYHPYVMWMVGHLQGKTSMLQRVLAHLNNIIVNTTSTSGVTYMLGKMRRTHEA
jgi:hypothetical protein